MSTLHFARRAALVIAAGALSLGAASSAAVAQRAPRRALGPSEPASQPAATPYPGPSVMADQRWAPRQPYQPLPGPLRRHQPQSAPTVVYYVPVPGGYPYGSSYSSYTTYSSYPGYPAYPTSPAVAYGRGGVYDTNGRPLSSGFDSPAPAPSEFPAATPDLSGSPYVVIEGGVMVVELGYGDRRAVPSCAVLAAERAPDGQPRTLFYQPPADGLVLRAGQHGQVLGAPPAGAPACYTTNSFGRVVLDY